MADRSALYGLCGSCLMIADVIYKMCVSRSTFCRNLELIEFILLIRFYDDGIYAVVFIQDLLSLNCVN